MHMKSIRHLDKEIALRLCEPNCGFFDSYEDAELFVNSVTICGGYFFGGAMTQILMNLPWDNESDINVVFMGNYKENYIGPMAGNFNYDEDFYEAAWIKSAPTLKLSPHRELEKTAKWTRQKKYNIFRNTADKWLGMFHTDLSRFFFPGGRTLDVTILNPNKYDSVSDIMNLLDFDFTAIAFGSEIKIDQTSSLTLKTKSNLIIRNWESIWTKHSDVIIQEIPYIYSLACNKKINALQKMCGRRYKYEDRGFTVNILDEDDILYDELTMDLIYDWPSPEGFEIFWNHRYIPFQNLFVDHLPLFCASTPKGSLIIAHHPQYFTWIEYRIGNNKIILLPEDKTQQTDQLSTKAWKRYQRKKKEKKKIKQ